MAAWLAGLCDSVPIFVIWECLGMMFFLLVFFFSDDSIVWKISNDDFSNYVVSLDRIAATDDEQVFVLDWPEQKIYRLDSNGKETKVFGGKGDGPGEMRGGVGIQYNATCNCLYVYDWSKAELLSFSLEGEPIPSKIPSRGNPTVINERRFAYIDAPGEGSEPNQGAKVFLEDLSAGTKRLIFENDASRHQDPAIVSNEAGTAIMGFDWYATTLIALSRSNNYLALGSNMELKFRIYDVQKRAFIGDIGEENVIRPPLRAKEIQATPGKARVGNRVYTAEDFPHPDYKPPVSAVFFDSADRLWVELTTAWNAKQRQYLVYQINGGFVGGFQTTAENRVFHANERMIWVNRHDKAADRWFLMKKGYTLSKQLRP